MSREGGLYHRDVGLHVCRQGRSVVAALMYTEHIRVRAI